MTAGSLSIISPLETTHNDKAGVVPKHTLHHQLPFIKAVDFLEEKTVTFRDKCRHLLHFRMVVHILHHTMI